MHARRGLTLVRTRDYPRPSFAPAERRCERGSGLAERGSPRRNPLWIAGSRSQPENGSTTSDSVQVNWPSTSSSPVTPSEPPDRDAPRLHRARASAPRVRHGHRAVSRPARVGRLDRHRHGQRRDRRRRDPGHHGATRRSSGSVRAGRSSRRCALATSSSPPAPFASRRRPASSSMTATRPSRTTRRSSPSSRPRSGSATAHHVGSHRHGAGLLRRAGAPDPAAAHPLP